MIRYSNKKDIYGIIQLWNEAFGDCEKEIRFFLDSCYKPQNTVIYEADGEIVSMLFLLEGDMHINGTDYPSYYLYAACTMKKFRGRGIMAQLLDYAKKTAAGRGKSFICLRPGEKSLFDFYEKFGYKSVFKIKRVTANININDLNTASESDSSVCDREFLRNKAFSLLPYFKWDKQFIDFAFLHNKFYGGNSVECCKGYSLYGVRETELLVKETTFTDLKSLVNTLPSKIFSSAKELTVNFSPDVNDEGEILPFAMLLAVNNETEEIIKNIDNAYMGLTLE